MASFLNDDLSSDSEDSDYQPQLDDTGEPGDRAKAAKGAKRSR